MERNTRRTLSGIVVANTNDKTITVIVQENDETKNEYNFDFMPLIATNSELLTQNKTIIGAINEIYTLLQNK